MRNAMIVILAIIFAGSIFGQDTNSKNVLSGTGELEVTKSGNETTPQVKVFLTYGGKTETGLYCWIQSSESYSQVYCGPTYQPSDWLQVGVAVGLETHAKPFRKAIFVWSGKGKFSNLFLLEQGGTGVWYRNQANYQVSKSLELSLATQRFEGTGPRIEFSIPKSNFKVGGEYLFSTQTAKFGVKFNF